VASSWRNAHQPQVVQALKTVGHEVYDFRNPPDGGKGFHWSEIDPEWKAWQPDAYRAGLSHHVAQHGFDSDFEGMRWAEMVVLVLPSGRSSHMEAGWMMGQGKPGVIYVPEPVEPELMYLVAGEFPRDWMAVDVGEVLLCVARTSQIVDSRPNTDRELIGAAIGVAVANDGASVALLQRRLNLGYCRSSYIIDRMVEMGVLGEFKTPQTCVRKCMLTIGKEHNQLPGEKA
jgi:DNA segregation ATPase FtsK/SpoIIIE-like protein